MAADETVTLNDAFSFIIAEGVQDGERFQIDVDMTDGRQTWSGKVFITAGQAILDFAGASWANSFVPGETLTLAASFQNIGHYMATHAIANITCESEYVTILNPTVELGTIDPEGLATAVFQITISESCPETEQITVNFTMQADGDLTAEGSLIMKNSCNVIFELSDSYGDGWNGNRLIVSFDDGTPNQTLTINDGESATYTLEIGNGVHVTLTWQSGNYTYECSFTVKYEDGTLIYQSSGISSGQLFDFDCNCGSGTPAGIFAPVENLAASVETESVTLTWDAPEGAINFIVMRNGLEIGQTTEPTYVDEVDKEDSYTYCVTAEYREGSSVPECVLIQAEWGIAEGETEFSIYPNPVSSMLSVSCGNAEFSYTMLNGMGQVVATGNGRGKQQIDVNGLAKGMYFLRLTSGSQVLVEKVVVK